MIDNILDIEDYKEERYECQCGAYHHTLVVSSYNGDKTLYLSMAMIAGGFWSRLWNAVKYVFNFRDAYGGQYHDFYLSETDAAALLRFADAHYWAANTNSLLKGNNEA